MADLTVPVDVPAGPEIRQQVGSVQRLAERLYTAARALRDLGHHVAASGIEDAAFAATLWSDSPVASAVAPDRPATQPVDLPAVLSSVDDVARVCEAAELAAGCHGTWSGEGARPSVTAAAFGGNVDQVDVDSVGGGQTVATLYRGAPSSLLWDAIQAARGGEPRG